MWEKHNVSTLEELRPRTRKHVIHLVAEAGIDVTDWSNVKGGRARASANPKYCYEWAFLGNDHLTVVNLWHNQLTEVDGKIFASMNVRDFANELGKQGQRGSWKRRARKLDHALEQAWRHGTRVRVIVNDGRRRDITDPNDRASRVEKRLLDPTSWWVESYDPSTGRCTVTRGFRGRERMLPEEVDPQEDALMEGGSERIAVNAYERNPEARRKCVEHFGHRCCICEVNLEEIYGGVCRDYIHVHHVIPVSQRSGPYMVDPIADLRPVCPNCHAVLHRRSPPYEIEDVLGFIRDRKLHASRY
jgi:5-methylcytosine-specific restriction enzyme A